jgi:hypothetical protein
LAKPWDFAKHLEARYQQQEAQVLRAQNTELNEQLILAQEAYSGHASSIAELDKSAIERLK